MIFWLFVHFNETSYLAEVRGPGREPSALEERKKDCRAEPESWFGPASNWRETYFVENLINTRQDELIYERGSVVSPLTSYSNSLSSAPI